MEKKKHTLGAGEPWYFEDNTTVFHNCCDCGLKHIVVIDDAKVGVITRWYRDDWGTSENRKRDHIILYRKKENKEQPV